MTTKQSELEEALSKKFNEYFEYCKTMLKDVGIFFAPYSNVCGWLVDSTVVTEKELDSLAFEIVYRYFLAGVCPYDNVRAFYDPDEDNYYSEGACLLDFSAAEVK